MPKYKMTIQEWLRTIEVFFYLTFPFYISKEPSQLRKYFKSILKESNSNGFSYKRDYNYIEIALNVLENELINYPDTRECVMTLWFHNVPIWKIRILLGISDDRILRYLDKYDINEDWLAPSLHEGSHEELIKFMEFCDKNIHSKLQSAFETIKWFRKSNKPEEE
ncbi:hypothetical protein P5G62_010190 [Neobacillus sp. 179-C4.2 HS]|uniref:Uncharacterized protein n=1 Tax=Neobacillus driksii TaxID=3035913 RepID=A0ABV4YSC7_9BACI|nr:hypothetical protein [Neobacillus sp. 179.-C4.2 HS]MDP5195051.1 hypothetical protein [Neobacillus sp. 179.-C4.2 HS]